MAKTIDGDTASPCAVVTASTTWQSGKTTVDAVIATATSPARPVQPGARARRHHQHPSSATSLRIAKPTACR